LALSAWVANIIAIGQPEAKEEPPRDYWKYARIIKAEAYTNWGLQVDTTRFPPQIQQESWFKSDAENRIGAAGLGQFMPKTRDWIIELFPSLQGFEDPDPRFNPVWSIRAIILYDRWLWERTVGADTDHHWAFVYSSYNGGLGWVRKDQQLLDGRKRHEPGLRHCERDMWFGCVEECSNRGEEAFRENRDYVHKIFKLWKTVKW